METLPLSATVDKFASKVQAFSDADLERPWDWQDYHEGIRFAYFRTCEQISTLAARLEVERAASPCPLSVAQRILGQYHAAYRDLQAVLLGLTAEQAAQPPAAGEWPLRQVLAHIVQADRGFLTAIDLGLDHLRAGKPGPFELTEAAWNNFWVAAPFRELEEHGSLAEIQAYYAGVHNRVLKDLTPLSASDLGLAIPYWESQPYTVEFRLHRFTSHLRQHTVQAEKTLLMLGLHPSESKRLLRQIYHALAGVEALTLGDDCFGLEHQAQLAAEIERLTSEIG